MNRRLLHWLLGLLGIAVAGFGIAAIIALQDAPRIAAVLIVLTAFLVHMWIVGGLLRWQTPAWLFWTLVYAAVMLVAAGGIVGAHAVDAVSLAVVIVFIQTFIHFTILWQLISADRRATHATLAIVGFDAVSALVLLFWFDGRPMAATAVVGMGAMAALFALGLWLLNLALSGSHPIAGVARTVVAEALRLRVALIMLILVVLIVPILPTTFNPAERLSYRVQTFITYALMISLVLLSLMTIFIACWTVSAELKQRQIFLTMTKPVSRLNYLVGKIIGIALLNLVLLTVIGFAVYSFVLVVKQQETTFPGDRAVLLNEVLAARESVTPAMISEEAYKTAFDRRVLQLQREQPGRYGDVLTERQLDDVHNAVRLAWHAIGPGDTQTYRFNNVDRAEPYTDYVQWRLNVRMTGSSANVEVPIRFRINGSNWYNHTLVNRIAQTIPLRVSLADAEGRLVIDLQNLTNQSLSFEPGEGMEMLYQVSSFEANLLRLLMMTWLLLCFLAMAGLLCGTFLSFPTACLFGLFLFFGAITSEFLGDALSYYGKMGATGKATGFEYVTGAFGELFERIGEGNIEGIIQVAIHIIARGVQAIIPSFPRYVPISELADGRLISWASFGWAVLSIGLLGTGITLLISWWIFSRREMARVIV